MMMPDTILSFKRNVSKHMNKENIELIECLTHVDKATLNVGILLEDVLLLRLKHTMLKQGWKVVVAI